ncbi:MAG: hypothetical protein QGG40_05815 [Myxococcota bacterium]|jgi:hypothetical protein|nr:hypothetical protein [Myxococcota bacterium]
MRRTFIVGSLLSMQPVAWGGNVKEAEHVRLSEEIENLTERQVWNGVERRFQDLAKLGVELNRDDYLNGAYAARELGNVEACYQRLQAAKKLESSQEIRDWISHIEENYGYVELVTVPSRSSELRADEPPFDPNQRKCLDAAMETAQADGSFTGYLPKGSYSFSGQVFEVEPGINVRIEVSPRVRRQGVLDPVIRYPDKPADSQISGE